MINKFKIQSSKFKVIFIISLFTFHFSLFTSSALALDSTPSAEIKIKLEDLKKEIASKAAKLKEAISQKLTNKAYVGTVENNTATEITLITKTGAKIVTINQDTVFESKVKKQTRSSKTLSLKDYVATLGDIDDTGVLTAKKIILLPPPAIEPKTYLWGQIFSISDKLITLKDKNAKNVAVSLNSQSQVKLNDFVILTGTKNRNDIFEANFIFVIP